MNKKLILSAAAVVVVAAAGYAWLHRDDAAPKAITLNGNVDIRQVELAFNASGRISGIEVSEGDRVSAGQLLARIDSERLRLSLQQAEAQAAAQQQVLARNEAGSRPEEIRQARAQRDPARASVQDAEQVYQRQLGLAERGFISQLQVDNSRYALDKARAQFLAAEETARLVELGPRKEDIAGARATLAAAEAAVAQLRRDIAETELRAPSAGVIDKRILESGDMASPQKPVFTLALTEPLWVRVWLPETQLGRVPVGASASVHTDSHPQKTYRAWVGYVSPAAEFTPKSVETADIRSSLVYQTRVYVCAGADELRQGMPATVTISLDQAARSPEASPCADGAADKPADKAAAG